MPNQDGVCCKSKHCVKKNVDCSHESTPRCSKDMTIKRIQDEGDECPRYVCGEGFAL